MTILHNSCSCPARKYREFASQLKITSTVIDTNIDHTGETQTVTVGHPTFKGMQIGEINFWGCVIRNTVIALGFVAVVILGASILGAIFELSTVLPAIVRTTPTILPMNTLTPTLTNTLTISTMVSPTPIPTATTITVTIAPMSTPIYSLTQQEALNSIERVGKITIGVRYDAPPFGKDENWSENRCDPSKFDPSFNPEGYDILIAREFAKRWLKDENAVEWRCVSAPDRINAVRQGIVHIGVFALSKLPEHCASSTGVLCSITYMVDGQGILVQKGSRITKLCDVGDQTVAVLRGTSVQVLFPEEITRFCAFGTGSVIWGFTK